MKSSQEFADGRSFNAEKVTRIRQQWVQDHMKIREVEFTKSKNLNVFCGSWNVNGKKCDKNLDDWLLVGTKVADIYVVGFQEMVDLTAMNVALDSGKAQQRSLYWQEKLVDCLASTGFKFTKLSDKHLVGILLVVLVKDSLYSFVRDVKAANLGVGLMGVMGNKGKAFLSVYIFLEHYLLRSIVAIEGGVAIRFNLYDTPVCFVCSHLAAHRENVVGN